ncbi:Astrocytic phosphoprotein PEA-15 [Dissostichus eleginoides]|uniref:Astrocytic phosphoprotein PEA-15 n=1 Tax=Dissostichus eleginoides TaxID=100907 RepID=A0AAD9BUY7_DISEL|nr:Astrocytic phosphoprotein PEA-15 [Dissostichus eleginoides]
MSKDLIISNSRLLSSSACDTEYDVMTLPTCFFLYISVFGENVSYDFSFSFSTLFFQPLPQKDIIRQPSEDEIIKLAPPPKKV